MAFVFLHTSDWHIAKPFAGFGAEKGAILRKARLDAIDRLAAAARTAGARHVLVAGDVFDAGDLPLRSIREAVQRLRVHADLAWHMIPGNHDADRPGGVWERLARDGLPGNVMVHRSAGAAALADGVVLLPSPLGARALSEDPTAWMEGAATPADSLRIGLAHGSVRGFGGAEGPSVLIDPARARRAGLAYLALGDWHGVGEVAGGVWYSGTPEPDQFPANEPGFALAVTVAGAGAPAAVQRVATGTFAWERRAVTLARADDLAGLEREVAARAGGNRLLKLAVVGRVTLAGEAEVAERLQRLEAALFHLETDLAGLAVAAAADDAATLGEGDLREAAAQLELLAQGGGAEARIAGLALRRLHALVRVAEGAP